MQLMDWKGGKFIMRSNRHAFHAQSFSKSEKILLNSATAPAVRIKAGVKVIGPKSSKLLQNDARCYAFAVTSVRRCYEQRS